MILILSLGALLERLMITSARHVIHELTLIWINEIAVLLLEHVSLGDASSFY